MNRQAKTSHPPHPESEMHELENGSVNPAFTADTDKLDIPAVTKEVSDLQVTCA